ncbi:MAG: winged helix-turn-helix transcriptional regulator [Candidatus Sungbacteria bacterium]|nr:winged helix-turn-helix transcriptional regulator [Candidatus Sungbacteria bacterium]
MDQDIKELERIIKAFANRRRLAIVRYLIRTKEATVGKIAEEINLSFKATSKHLGILLAADILEKEQRSLEMWYRIASVQKAAIRALTRLL